MVAPLACPQCGRPVAVEVEFRPKAFPFCSDRCRLLDLGAWADGDYVVPGRSALGGVDDGGYDDLDEALRHDAERYQGDDS